ncbi:hypothetical protein HT576_19485 [Haloterrigena sp. SYSU A121-1]|uniref:Uncharacterized protein n=1 Tax=Haloterrigena gelatinilytica TaxID=2741724 RepID=A0A8J8KHL2_9EURY|nr:DUF6498-containing protein [Haloterrigena gelatinilytica]NUB93192.1 hypothetical protein [Haloterrigena gelatinilytica]
MEVEPRGNPRAASLLLLVANLLPLAAIPLRGWRAYEVLFVYWIEIGLCIALYYALALFAQRDPESDRTGRLHPDPASFPRRSGSVKPLERLPPIRYRNVRYVPEALVMALGFWFFCGALFVDVPNPELSSASQGPLREYLAVIAAAATVEGLALAVLLFGVRLVIVGHGFFGQRQYERFSPSILADIPLRIVFFWFLLLVVLQVALVVRSLFAGALDPTATQRLAIAVVVASKLAIDRSLVQARYRTERGRFSRWLVPDESTADR